MLRAPLYYACISNWGEPESVVGNRLHYLVVQLGLIDFFLDPVTPGLSPFADLDCLNRNTTPEDLRAKREL